MIRGKYTSDSRAIQDYLYFLLIYCVTLLEIIPEIAFGKRQEPQQIHIWAISFLMAKHNLSMKTQFLSRELSNFHNLYYTVPLISYSFYIYRFKRDNSLSENVIFESKTCMQHSHHSKSLLFLDLRSWLCDVRLLERLGPLPPDIHVEDNCCRQ